jgi:hypothetical protein
MLSFKAKVYACKLAQCLSETPVRLLGLLFGGFRERMRTVNSRMIDFKVVWVFGFGITSLYLFQRKRI